VGGGGEVCDNANRVEGEIWGGGMMALLSLVQARWTGRVTSWWGARTRHKLSVRPRAKKGSGRQAARSRQRASD
jgi:hypothetical protein